MTREELKNWTLSEYNEDTEDQLDYYINERKCNVGDKAYVYDYSNNKLFEMEIINIIARSDNTFVYDKLLETEVLLDGENEFDADTSAEFITDNNCYLVWFKYV